MSSEAPQRASLESMTPAIIGIGFLHVLAGMVIWIVLPLLSRDSDRLDKKHATLVWRAPDDFTEAKISVQLPVSGGGADKKAVPLAPVPLAQPSSPVIVAATASSPPTAPVKRTDQAPNEPTANLQSLPTGEKKASSTKVSFEIPMLQQPTAPAVLQQDTLAKLEQAAGTSLQDLLGASGAMTIQSPPAANSSSPSTAPVAGPTPSLPPATGREANKYITLSAIHDSSKPVKPTLNLLDIAKLNEAEREQQKALRSSGLDAVEQALQQTLLRAWMPPSLDLVPANQRRVSVELVVLRDGSVREVVLKNPSGSDELDDSVRAALVRVTKIPESLPANFPKERYAVRVNLQIE